MTLNSKTLAATLVIVLFGGIALATALGWWQTESSKLPAAYTDGEFAGQANPADIRGSYTFGDIANSFAVSPESLAQAFGVTSDDPAAFQVKSLEEIYAGSPVEIGTASVRVFVAVYAGLPYDLAGAADTYLPQTAVEVLNEHGNLTPEQTAWLATHSASAVENIPTPALTSVAETPLPALEMTSTPQAASAETEYVIKGKTTFGELLSWGVPSVVIEQLIGGALPDPAMTLKDYASAHSLDFETLKPALQAEVDKVVKQ
jgi:hypothetical protein